MIYFDIYLFFPTIVGPLWFVALKSIETGKVYVVG